MSESKANRVAMRISSTAVFFGMLFFISSSTFVLTSCTKGKNSGATIVDQATKEGILHKGNGTEPQDLDPNIVTGVPEHNIIAALFEGLVGEDPKDLHPIPGMAESWSVSSNGMVFTFKIRKEAKWSNGDPFTANDFLYSWKRLLSPALGSEYAYMLHVVKNAKAYNEGKIKDFSKVGAKVLDPHTFQVTLENPTPYFLYLLQHYSTWPVHQATIEKFGKMDERGTKWTRPENIVSNGPFVLKTWELNKIIIVEKNKNYWDADKVRLNAIHFHPIESEQTEERKFRAGELHVTNVVPLTKIEVYQEKEPNLISISPYLGTYYYRFNTTKKPLNDKRVRKALSLSIDRASLVKNVTRGGQLPALSFVPPGTSGYTSEHLLQPNIDAAKKLLAEAGYPDGKGFPSIEILYNTMDAHKVIAEALQQMWKKNLGINVTLSNQDWKVYLDSQKNLQYDMSRAGWIGDYPDPNTFMDMFVTGGGNNQTGWSNKEYDRLIAKAATVQNAAKRLEVFQEAEKILLDESPILPIYIYTKQTLIHPDVKGWYPNILDHHPYKDVYLESSKGVSVAEQK